MSVVNRDPQSWAYMLDLLFSDDTHETWMKRLRIARSLWG